ERTALNLLGHLSGIATRTRRLVDAVAGTGATIIDTRKTLPGLRALQKYAVTVGGGRNHRLGLDDAILLKDNHIAACGSLTEAVRRVRAGIGHTVKVEVEVDTLAQFEEALGLEPEIILLDNFTTGDLRTAVARRNSGSPIQRRILLETSGRVTEATVRALAETGVDLISVGALTHSVTVLDIGLDDQ
ncbi:MAG TPA: carboxylating nicotinate-nucleotide diphosphorylase, partial [Spirochaetia bacterium]|nr:carboxylating nicotinate-nucleotide diphosphorylase [Spirochaetia bacterium]